MTHILLPLSLPIEILVFYFNNILVHCIPPTTISAWFSVPCPIQSQLQNNETGG